MGTQINEWADSERASYEHSDVYLYAKTLWKLKN